MTKHDQRRERHADKTVSSHGAQGSLCHILERAALDTPDQAAIVADGAVVSYSDLGSRAQAVARLIGQDASRNPRIALLCDGGLAHVLLYWGVLLAGGVTVELNPELGEAELCAQLHDAKPALLITNARHWARLADFGLSPQGAAEKVAVLEGTGLTDDLLGPRLMNAIARRSPQPSFESRPWPAPSCLASIVYTSGTTGRTKGVCLTHGSLAWTALAITTSLDLKPRQPGERFSGLLPLYYTYGKSVLHIATMIGAPIVFAKQILSPTNLIEYLNAGGITHLSTVPYLCTLLLTSPRFTAAALPHVSRITIAGGAVSEGVMAELLRRFPDRIVPMYGLTEASTRVACMPAREAVQRPRSCGRPIPGVEVKIVGTDGRPRPPLDEGEILVRGPNVMQGYFHDAEATAATLVDHWLHTGDLGFVDKDGYLTVSGRIKDVIKVMGESVSPLAIESTLVALPDITEAAVTGVPDDLAGEAIVAFVVRRGNSRIGEAEIRAHCARKLGRTRVPSRVVFLDRLPRTSSGKVRKHLLTPDGQVDLAG